MCCLVTEDIYEAIRQLTILWLKSAELGKERKCVFSFIDHFLLNVILAAIGIKFAALGIKDLLSGRLYLSTAKKFFIFLSKSTVKHVGKNLR